MQRSNTWTRSTRRSLLKGSAVAMAGMMVSPASGWPASGARSQSLDITDGVVRDPRVKALLTKALDAARSAGASYADGRITYTRTRSFQGLPPLDSITMGLSVRALVNGYWGWAATPMLLAEEAPRVGTAAVALAQSLATTDRPRIVEWTPMPAARGDWVTPIQIDPFETALEELIDWGMGVREYIERLGRSRGGETKVDLFDGGGIYYQFHKQERAFASTEGSDVTQTVYRTNAQVAFQYRNAEAQLEHLGSAAAGWEFVQQNAVRESVLQQMEYIDDNRGIPIKPIDIGRYDIVFSHTAMANILGATLAEATQLDRALGYEANASGTSYLGPDPYTYLGSAVAAPTVSVTANRSVPQGLATIGWDDEGVKPADFTLIQDGVLTDYQTTREQASWLSQWNTQRRVPSVSHGCAMAPTALELPMQHTPNLALTPGKTEQDFDALISGLDKGLAIGTCAVQMDQQALNGFGRCGAVFEVRAGKRVSRAALGNTSQGFSPMGLLFRSSEFWKGISALGGPGSLRWRGGGRSEKGDPARTTAYSIGAVPAVVKQLTIIDPKRKA